MGPMDKEKLLSLHRRFHQAVPRTPGEKMVATGIGIDAGVIISISALYYLQREGITNITPELAETIKYVLVFGGHILISDFILKLGGTYAMIYLEDENWLRKKVPRPETNNTLRTGKFLMVDSEDTHLQLEGLPSGVVPYIDNRDLLRLGFLSSPRFWNSAISLIFILYPEKKTEFGSEYNLEGQHLKNYLINRSITIIDVNRKFASGALAGHVAELPYPTSQEIS